MVSAKAITRSWCYVAGSYIPISTHFPSHILSYLYLINEPQYHTLTCTTFQPCIHGLIWASYRRKHKSPKLQKKPSVQSVRSVKSSRNDTLRRQHSNPADEWDRVLMQNGENAPLMRQSQSKDMEIIHNVPLDPRATLERPLHIPQRHEYVAVQRNTVGNAVVAHSQRLTVENSQSTGRRNDSLIFTDFSPWILRGPVASEVPLRTETLPTTLQFHSGYRLHFLLSLLICI